MRQLRREFALRIADMRSVGGIARKFLEKGPDLGARH
jgi:hypothetical protein